MRRLLPVRGNPTAPFAGRLETHRFESGICRGVSDREFE